MASIISNLQGQIQNVQALSRVQSMVKQFTGGKTSSSGGPVQQFISKFKGGSSSGDVGILGNLMKGGGPAGSLMKGNLSFGESALSGKNINDRLTFMGAKFNKAAGQGNILDKAKTILSPAAASPSSSGPSGETYRQLPTQSILANADPAPDTPTGIARKSILA